MFSLTLLSVLDVTCINLQQLFELTVLVKVFELFLTGDNTKSTTNTIMWKKYKKYSIFVKNVDVSKTLRGQ